MTHLIATGMLIGLMGTNPFSGISPTNPSSSLHNIDVNEFQSKTTLIEPTKIAGYYGRDDLYSGSGGVVNPCWNYSAGYVCR